MKAIAILVFTLALTLHAAPEDAVPFGGHKYKLIVKTTTWEAARKHCASLGGQLACVETRQEMTFLERLTGTKGFWLGAKGASGKSFKVGETRWVNGRVVTGFSGVWWEKHPWPGQGTNTLAALYRGQFKSHRWVTISNSDSRVTCYVVEFGDVKKAVAAAPKPAGPLTVDLGRFGNRPEFVRLAKTAIGAKPFITFDHTIKSMPATLSGATLIVTRGNYLNMLGEFSVSKPCYLIIAVRNDYRTHDDPNIAKQKREQDAEAVAKRRKRLAEKGWKPLKGRFETTGDTEMKRWWMLYFKKVGEGVLPATTVRNGIPMVK